MIRARAAAAVLLTIACLASSCRPASTSREAERSDDPVPVLSLTDAEKDVLLFPALHGAMAPRQPRCVPARHGEPPLRWLDEAEEDLACTVDARAAVAASAPDEPSQSGVGRLAAAHLSSPQEQLTAAALCDDADAIHRLVEHGADANRRDACGSTALVVAAAAGSAHAVDALLEAGARPNLESRQGRWSRTPLEAAVLRGDDAIAGSLLDHGASPEPASPAGRDALMLAAMTNDDVLVRRLLHRKADACRRDSHGMTAEDVARFFGNTKIVEILHLATQHCTAVAR